VIRALLCLFALAVTAAACATLPAAGGLSLRHDVGFEGADSTTAFELRPNATAIDVESATNQLLARLTLDGARLRVENGEGELRGFVVPPATGSRSYHVIQADGSTQLFEFSREPDGDLNLKDAAGAYVYKIKLRDNGYKVEDMAGATETRIRAREGKISLRNASDETVLSTRDPFSAEAAAAISLEKVPFEFAAGLAVAVSHWGFASK
jgi:hypothetical protein